MTVLEERVCAGNMLENLIDLYLICQTLFVHFTTCFVSDGWVTGYALMSDMLLIYVMHFRPRLCLFSQCDCVVYLELDVTIQPN